MWVRVYIGRDLRRESREKRSRDEERAESRGGEMRIEVRVTRVLKGCYKDVTRVLQRCYKDVTRVLQGCWCYKGVTRVLQGITKVLQYQILRRVENRKQRVESRE
jgi:hypothetical protein